MATVDYEANLAVLTPKEAPEDFFDGLVPFPLSVTPPKKDDRFEVWQFEANGTPVTSAITYETARLGRTSSTAVISSSSTPMAPSITAKAASPCRSSRTAISPACC